MHVYQRMLQLMTFCRSIVAAFVHSNRSLFVPFCSHWNFVSSSTAKVCARSWWITNSIANLTKINCLRAQQFALPFNWLDRAFGVWFQKFSISSHCACWRKILTTYGNRYHQSILRDESQTSIKTILIAADDVNTPRTQNHMCIVTRSELEPGSREWTMKCDWSFDII